MSQYVNAEFARSVVIANYAAEFDCATAYPATGKATLATPPAPSAVHSPPAATLSASISGPTVC